MISNQQIKEIILPRVEKNCRKIDYYSLKNIIENHEEDIINELIKFQNDDGGFGNGLEPDIRLPGSSVAATDVAINILEEITDIELKKPLIKDIVQYLEKVFDDKTEAWEIVPKEVDDYPHAVWWNYDQIESFTYANPNPEVIGFLFQNRKYLKRIDINRQITKVVQYILNELDETISMHSLLSILRFFVRVDKDVQNLIRDKIQFLVNKLVEFDKTKWDDYVLMPHIVGSIDKSLLKTKQDVLEEDLSLQFDEILQRLPNVKWQWFQFEDVFEEIKNEWVGRITFEIVKALRMNRKQ